jgi:F-type H+-transporting ATPase subunit gamma
VQVFRALLENAASEQGARMSAMDNATRNAGEMIRKQTLTYNRTRQAMITKELIEIISGAEALYSMIPKSVKRFSDKIMLRTKS